MLRLKKLRIFKNEAPGLCGECGGACCHSSPGIYHPSDLGKTPTSIQARLIAGFKDKTLAIDWWEGSDPLYFVRPRTVKALDKIMDPTYGGTCMLWKDKIGCSLSFAARPAQCRALVPSSRGSDHCTMPSGFSKHDMAVAWLPYKDAILAARDAVSDDET